MGYIMHDAIVVTPILEEEAERIRQGVVDILKNHNEQLDTDNLERLVSPLIEGMCNGYYTFLVGPDGSKEGWKFSNDMTFVYDEIKRYLETKSCNFVHIRYGESPSYIVNSEG